MKNTLTFLLFILFFLQCKKTADITSLNIPQINGLVQKGPFSSGTQVLMYELKKNLSQTGKIYTTITDNRGTFLIKDINLTSDFVLLSSNGFYYNEVLGSLSPSQLQLFALADIKYAASINVNILTHLEKRRVEYLVAQRKTFSESKKQAQSEILAVFGISNVMLRESEKLDISYAGDENAILLAISLILQGNLSVGDFSELLSTISADLEQDGKLENTTALEKLKSNVFSLNLPNIRKNLENRYQSLEMIATIPNFEKYIQQYLSKFPIDINKGLVAYYPFNGNANDESGNGKHGALNRVVLTEDRFNETNRAYYFDPGSNITVPHSSNLNINSDFSVSLWYLPNSTYYAQDLVMKGPDNQLYSWWIRHHTYSVDPNVNFAYKNQLSSAIQIGAPYPALNQWTNIIGTVDGSKMIIYKNGIQIASISSIDFSNSLTNTNVLTFGTLQYSFSGKIDDIRIYNRALTQEEITYLASH